MSFSALALSLAAPLRVRELHYSVILRTYSLFTTFWTPCRRAIARRPPRPGIGSSRDRGALWRRSGVWSADAECGVRSADAECGCACRSVLKVAAERPLNMAPPDVAAAPRPRRDRVQPSGRQSAAIRSTTPAPRSGSTSHTPVSAEVGAASESDGAPDQWNGLRGLLARRCPTQDTAVPGHRRAPCEPVERDPAPYPLRTVGAEGVLKKREQTSGLIADVRMHVNRGEKT